MNMLNSIILEGKITKAGCLECQFTDIPQLTCTIAVERFYKGVKGDDITEVSEFDIVAYHEMAEYLESHKEIGRGLRVVGRLKQLKWVDGEKEHSRVVVIAEHIEFKPLKKKETENEASVF